MMAQNPLWPSPSPSPALEKDWAITYSLIPGLLWLLLWPSDIPTLPERLCHDTLFALLHDTFFAALGCPEGWFFLHSSPRCLWFASDSLQDWLFPLFFPTLPIPHFLHFSLSPPLHPHPSRHPTPTPLPRPLETTNEKMHPGDTPLLISHCPLLWGKLLFSTALQSCQLQLCSPPFTESSRGGGAAGVGRAGGDWHSPFSLLLTQRSASLSTSRTRPWETDSPTVTMGYTNITSI